MTQLVLANQLYAFRCQCGTGLTPMHRHDLVLLDRACVPLCLQCAERNCPGFLVWRLRWRQLILSTQSERAVFGWRATLGTFVWWDDDTNDARRPRRTALELDGRARALTCKP